MNPLRIPPAFIFLVLANLLTSVRSQSSCLNNGNYTANSTYKANLNNALSALSTNIDDNGFYNVSVGHDPDRANAAALCRGDIQLDKCRECVRNTTDELLRSCPNQKQAIDLAEFCMVRYSNETIFGKLDTSLRFCWWNPNNNVSSPDKFKDDLRKLMDNLRGRAANGGPLRKVAAGNLNAPDNQTIYALVQCTPDLSREDCSSCLIGAAAEIPNCCDRKRGGRILKPSCTLRFEDYRFYKETRLQELAPAPTPAPVPTPVPNRPAVLSPPGNGDGDKTRNIIIVVVSVAASVILAVTVGI